MKNILKLLFSSSGFVNIIRTCIIMYSNIFIIFFFVILLLLRLLVCIHI